MIVSAVMRSKRRVVISLVRDVIASELSFFSMPHCSLLTLVHLPVLPALVIAPLHVSLCINWYWGLE